MAAQVMKGDTWPKVLRFNCEKYGTDRLAMRYKHYGIWRPYRWKDYYLEVKHLASGLAALGFEHNDRVLIAGENTPQLYAADLAAQAGRGVSLEVDPDLEPHELAEIAHAAGPRFAVVQDQEQVDKLLEIKDRLPGLLKIIYWSYKGLAHYDDPLLLRYREVIERGIAYDAAHQGLFEETLAAGAPGDVCALVYPPGSGGRPTACTYESTMAATEQFLNRNRWNEQDSLVPVLPPRPASAQWSTIGCHLLSGCTLNFAEGPETVQQDAREIGPTIVWHASGSWERRAADLKVRIAGADAATRLVFRILLPVGSHVAELSRQGRAPGTLLRLWAFIANAVLFRRIRRTMGLQNARICYSSGGPLSARATHLYQTLGVGIESLNLTTETDA